MPNLETREEIIKDLRERIIKSFLDIIVLVELKEKPQGGYDIITGINEKFKFLMSSGTVYALLSSLERDGLVQGHSGANKRIYTLTDKGNFKIETIMKEQYMEYCARTFKILAGSATS